MIVCETEGVQVLFTDYGSSYLMITFAPVNLMADGCRFFGDGIAKRGRISTLGFVAKEENCYPPGDILKTMPAVQRVLDCYREKISVGHSMGAYAVIKYASLLGTNIAVAMSPQYSINPGDVPEQYRWYAHRYRDELHRDMRITAASAHGRIYVLFDNKYCKDRVHVDLIAQNVPVIKVPIPYVEHETVLCFTTAAALTQLFDLCRSDDRVALRRFALQRRNASRIRALGLGLATAERRPQLARTLRDRYRASLDKEHFIRLSNKIARSAITHGAADLAMDVLNEVLVCDHTDVDAHRGMTEAHALRDSLPEAIEWARKVVRLEPGNADWRAQVVLLLLRQDNLTDALAEVEVALCLHPSHPVLLFLRAEVAERQGALDEAIEWLRRSSAADPAALYPRQRLGRLLFQAGDLGAAAEQYNQVLACDPNDRSALDGLRDVRSRQAVPVT